MENIVYAHYDKTMKEIPQHLVHVCQADGKSIDQAIWHHPIFIVPLVPFSNPDQIVCTAKIELGVDGLRRSSNVSGTRGSG